MTASSASATPLAIDRDLAFEVERFYYREARLLDERRFREWLALVTPDVTYTIPVRYTAMVPPERRGKDDMHDPAAEISGPGGNAFREENHLTLSIRVDRAYKVNSWSDNPAPRTRRFVGNVQLEPGDEPGSLLAHSNLLLAYSRHGDDNYTYTAGRRDLLRRAEGEGDFRIARREVILDWNVIVAPSVGLFF